MKKHLATLLLIIVFLTSGKCYSQITRTAVSANQYAPYVYTTAGTDNKVKSSIDSLAKVLRAEIKLSDAANQKALKDSMGAIPYLDEKSLPLVNGKVTVNYKPSYDSTGVVAKNLTTTNTTLNTVSNKVTVLEMATLNLTQRVNSTETAIISINSSISNIQSQLTTINSKIATIPTKAVSVSTSTTTTTTQTTLAP